MTTLALALLCVTFAAQPAEASPSTPPPPDFLLELPPAPEPTFEAPKSLDDLPVIVPAPTTTPTVPTPVAADRPPPTVPRMLVLDLVDKGAGPDVVKALTAAVSTQAVRSASGEVVTTQQLALALDAAATQQMLGCETEGCMTDLARRVEAERVLGGSVAKVGDDLLITLLVVDVKDARRLGEVQRKVPEFGELHYYAAKELTSLLLTGRATSGLVPVHVAASESGAMVIVDGAERGPAPLTLELDPGAHEIRVEHDDYASWRTLITVEEATPLVVTASLVEERLPLWPATLAVLATSMLAAAGATGAGLYALELYDGSITRTPQALAASYKYGSPVDSLTLAERAVTVQGWQLASNVLWGVSGVLLVSAVLIETADVILWATAE